MSQRKAATLGMPHGTASNRLRKAIMYKYIRLANEHFCFKCGAEIESVDDLSVEHKLPWEGVSAELFFDLDNIAFSHVQCNRPDRARQKWLNKTEGYKRCSVCKKEKPLEDFHRKSNNLSDGRQGHCKKCHSSWRRRCSS